METIEREEAETETKLKNASKKSGYHKKDERPEENSGTETVVPDSPREKDSGLTFSEKIELEKLEEKIAGKEAESKMIAREIELAGNDFEKIAKLSEQLGDIEKELEALTERWMELSEKEG